MARTDASTFLKSAVGSASASSTGGEVVRSGDAAAQPANADAAGLHAGPWGAAPTGRPARWVIGFIAVYLLVQLALPLRFYFSAPTNDERFAWRMFSYEGMHKCTASAWDVVERDGKRVSQRVELREVTFGFRVENHRPDVIQAFMRWRCEQPGVVQSRVTIRCKTPSGQRLEPVHYLMDRAEGVVRKGESGS